MFCSHFHINEPFFLDVSKKLNYSTMIQSCKTTKHEKVPDKWILFIDTLFCVFVVTHLDHFFD